jgi:thioesterase domain-containing protein
MFQSNPNLVQEIPRALQDIQPPLTPIVLIHDGGGTIYSYFCLGWLNRTVYGIHNPHYGTDKVWEGGIPQMARHYVKLIKEVHPEGDLILGGWSLGGLLSLEASRLLADDPKINVLGIIMIDSVYPRAPVYEKLGNRVVKHVTEWSETTKEATKESVQRCFDEAVRMVREWNLPTWERSPDDELYGRELKPPPVWLLRAEEPVPVLEEGVSRVDLWRQDRYLGWDQYREGMIVRVDDIPGHHFNIFNMDHIDAVTEKLRIACEEVEDWAHR